MQASPPPSQSGRNPSGHKKSIQTSAQLRLAERIRLTLPELSAQFQAIGNYCLSNTSSLHRMRIEDASQQCGARPSTIVRFAKRFGLNGYKELKVAFLDEAQSQNPATPESPQENIQGIDAYILHTASSILIVGDIPASPLTSYMDYALRCLGKHVDTIYVKPGKIEITHIARQYDLMVITALLQDFESRYNTMMQAKKNDTPIIFINGETPHQFPAEREAARQQIFEVSPLRNLTKAIETAQSLIRDLEQYSRHKTISMPLS